MEVILLTDLKLYLFGRPHLERNGETVSVRRRKALALLAYLAISGGERTPKANARGG